MLEENTDNLPVRWISKNRERNSMPFGERDELSLGDLIELISNDTNLLISEKTLVEIYYNGESKDISKAFEELEKFNVENNFGYRGIYLTLIRFGNVNKIFELNDKNITKNPTGGILNVSREIEEYLSMYDPKIADNFIISGFPDEAEIKK